MHASDPIGVSRSLQHLASPRNAANAVRTGLHEGDEDEFRWLAETAVGVREMSKQLGRARVQSNIQNVLIITKARDNRLIKLTRELALYLMLKHRRGSQRGLVVYVDRQLRRSKRFDAEGIRRDHPELFVPFPRRRTSSSHSLSSLSSHSTTYSPEDEQDEEGQLRYWSPAMCSHSPHLFDFVVTLGGDGTVLFTSWLFQRIVPPVLSFALGSLGFLTNFDFADHQAVIDSAIDNGIRVNLRMRFTCTVFRAVANEEGSSRRAIKKGETGEIMMKHLGGWEAVEAGGSFTSGTDGKHSSKDKEIMCFTTRSVETFEVLNDLVVDRGPSPYVSLLELFGDEHHMTTVQADGLTVSTPTGSTAYSLSAGGSLVHPEIPALLITPICPHTLSFRPMLLPDSMELRICVPYNSRSTAWASFDGRGRVELKQGDHIKVTASKYPFPTVCADKQSTDWFHAISRTLKWNERERQKSFVVVEEGPAKRQRKNKNDVNGSTADEKPKEEEALDDEEEDEVSEEEEDDKFDIDDSSPEAEGVASPVVDKTRRAKSRSKSRSRGTRTSAPSSTSGLDSPSRFAAPTPHIPISVGRHVEFDVADNVSTASSSPDLPSHLAQQGTRDDLRSPRPLSGKSRIPTTRDLAYDVKTPTLGGQGSYAGRGRQPSRSRSTDRTDARRAFAVLGHDESDSNASDNE
ncbi:ATP-NAD kinase-like domain-containing protein [Panaeolus papilionaceus]|nr:ATP-NAD kinase-like domain-containing protein [Panaeolus papilionaceus]